MAKWARFFLAGICAAIISYFFNNVAGFLFGSLYDPASGIWRAMLTPSWYQNVILANLLAGFLLVIGYACFNKALGNKKQIVKKGLAYGFIIWLIKDVIGFTMTYVLMFISGQLIAVWLATAFVIDLVAGMAIAGIYR
jgi:hypothetical protein